MHLTELCMQLFARDFRFHSVLVSKLLGHVRQPHVVVKSQIQDRAVHVQHQRLTAFKRDFGIVFHCFILRARSN